MKRLFTAFALLLAATLPALAQLPVCNWGDMYYRGQSSNLCVARANTAGGFLQSQGINAAPVWSNQASQDFLLPTQSTNTILGNATGSNASPSAIDVSTALDTIGYDTQRPPLTGSLLYKSATTWQAMPPSTSGWVLTTQGVSAIPQWAPPGTPVAPGIAGTCLVSNGVGVAPSYQNCIGTGSTGSALTKGDDTNVTLTLGGAPTTALVTAASITAGWTGQLGLTRGGTAASLTASNGGIVYSTASALAILSATATAGQILRSGSSAAPAWSTATYPATTAINTVLYSSAANVISEITTCNSGAISTGPTGVPACRRAVTLGEAGSASGSLILSGTTSGSVTFAVQNAAGTYNFNVPTSAGTAGQALLSGGGGAAAQTYGTLGIAAGGTGVTAAASGTVLNAQSANVWTASSNLQLGVAGGTIGQINLIGSTSGNVNIAIQAAAGTYNFNLPTSAGTSGQSLLSGGGGASPHTYGDRVSSATVAAGATSGIAVSGTCTITTTGTCTVATTNTLGANKFQTFTSGSGTLTTPTGALWMKVTLVGAGGGGDGSGSTAGTVATVGGDTCLDTSGAACTTPLLSGVGGSPGVWAASAGGAGGAVGGSSTCNVAAITGGGGQAQNMNAGGAAGIEGRMGGNSTLGGGGRGVGTGAGSSGALNSGGGGGGAGSSTISNFAGPGGGAGGTCIAYINGPAASYTYAVGSGGSGGTAGTGGQAGGSGAAGIIIAEFGFN